MIDISIKQLNKIKHCIGFDKEKYKRRKYTTYRNYYNCGGLDVDWEDLSIKGYAKKLAKTDTFIVTKKGYDLISMIYNIVITEGQST